MLSYEIKNKLGSPSTGIKADTRFYTDAGLVWTGLIEIPFDGNMLAVVRAAAQEFADAHGEELAPGPR